MIAIIDQQAFNAICNRIGCATVFAGYDWRATTHRFKDHMTKTIGDWVKNEARRFSVIPIEFISREPWHMCKHPSKIPEKLF